MAESNRAAIVVCERAAPIDGQDGGYASERVSSSSEPRDLDVACRIVVVNVGVAIALVVRMESHAEEATLTSADKRARRQIEGVALNDAV